MKVLSFLICLLVANAAVLPQKGLVVTKSEIDSLIKDYTLFNMRMLTWDVRHLLRYTELPVKIDCLKVYMDDLFLSFGDGLINRESSNLTNEELDVGLSVVQKDVEARAKLQIIGIFKGKRVNQYGNLNVSIATVGKTASLKAKLMPRSVTVTDINWGLEAEIGQIEVQMSGIEIDGISESELVGEITKGIKEWIIKYDGYIERHIPKVIIDINKFTASRSLQDLYNYMRPYIPILSVTEDDINTLVNDYVVDFINQMKEHKPPQSGSLQVPIQIRIGDLKAEAISLLDWIGDIKHSVSTNLTDEELDLSIEIVANDVRGESPRFRIAGTYQGKEIDQEGEMKFSVDRIEIKCRIKAQLTPKSVKFTDLIIATGFGEIDVEVSGIEIEGISNTDLENEIKKSLIEIEDKIKKLTPGILKQINLYLVRNRNLPQIYSELRKFLQPST